MAEHTGLGGLTVRNAAAVVVDGGSKNWVFVRVDTDDGVTGWGECYNFPGREGPVSAMVSQLGRYLRGRSVADIRPFAAYAFRDFGGKRASLELFSAISGIETAMWDALGKATGQPVHRLLGGSFRSGFRVYANGWSMNSCLGRQRIDDVVAAAVGLVEQGFTAMKFDPVPGPWHADLSAELERSTVECVREVRTAVGDSVDLLIELHRRFTLKPALRVVTALEEFRPYWFEEPVRVEDLAALAEIRRATVTPVVSGETLYGKEAFRSLLEAEAVDIINPDVGACGGIGELRDIAAMAEAHGVAVAPHNYNSTSVALAATLQASAGCSNYLITEYFVDAAPRSEAISAELPKPSGGMIPLPDAPGVGAELAPEVLARHPAREFPLRSFGPEEAADA